MGRCCVSTDRVINIRLLNTVTTDKERVLRGRWMEMRLWRYGGRRRWKIRAQAWSLFARLFNIQELEYSTSKQFLMIYTSTSSCLNFGTIVVKYFLIRPEFIQSGFKCVSRSACTTSLGRLFHILTILLVKKIAQIISCTILLQS